MHVQKIIEDKGGGGIRDLYPSTVGNKLIPTS